MKPYCFLIFFISIGASSVEITGINSVNVNYEESSSSNDKKGTIKGKKATKPASSKSSKRKGLKKFKGKKATKHKKEKDKKKKMIID